MTFFSIGSGLLCISSFFISLMWFSFVKSNLNKKRATLLQAELALTGIGLVFQSICMLAATAGRVYEVYAGIDMNAFVGFTIYGLVFSDFLLILAASLNAARRIYLCLYIGACLLWLAGNAFVYLMLKGMI